MALMRVDLLCYKTSCNILPF